MENSRSMELGKRKILKLPRGLIYSFDQDLTPGSSNYLITPPTNTPSFTSVTYAMVFTPSSNPPADRQDLLNGATQERPRLTLNTNNSMEFYYIGESPFFDIGINSPAGVVQRGMKNIFIGGINGTSITASVNRVPFVPSFQTGTARTENWNRSYRLSGLPNNTLLFEGTYNFFGIWSRTLSNTEIDALYNTLS